MIEFLISITGPMSLMAALLGVFWIVRCKKCVFVRDGILPIMILLYATWHFFVHHNLQSDFHLVIHNLFLTIVAVTIAIQCNTSNLKLKLNRRKEDKPHNIERRKEK